MIWKILGVLLIVIVLASLFWGFRDIARSGTKVHRRVLFSSIEGVLRAGEAPVAGATLTREWRLDEYSIQQKDEAVTDAQGRFSFPEVAIERAHGILGQFFPQEFFLSQKITVLYNGTSTEVWDVTKRSPAPGGEFRTVDFQPLPMPLRVTIDLESPFALRQFGEAGDMVFGHTVAIEGLELTKETPIDPTR